MKQINLPNPSDVVFVHYLCQEFEEGERILNLMLARGENSFIHRWDIPDPDSEPKALEEYFSFLDKECKNLITVHWNQMASYYGPSHLNSRYLKLTGKKSGFKYHNSFNLADYLINKYGDKYISHPRLDSLASLNKFSGVRETEKDKRTFPDQRLLLIMKIFHAEFWGELKIQKHLLNTDKSVADYLTSHKEEILGYLETELFKQKGKKVAVVIYALRELSLIEIQERKDLYDALRKILGDIGTDESLNKIMRYQITQLDYSTQAAIKAQMQKIKHHLAL